MNRPHISMIFGLFGLFILANSQVFAHATMQCLGPSGLASLHDCFKIDVQCAGKKQETINIFMDDDYTAAAAGQLYCQKTQNTSVEYAKYSRLSASVCLDELAQGKLKAIFCGMLTELKPGDCKMI